MSYRFDDALSQNINYGDVTFLDGLTTISGHAWVNLDDVASDHYILAKQSGGSGGILLLMDDVGSSSGRTDTFTVFISDGTTSVKVEGVTNAASTSTWIPVGFSIDMGTGGLLNLWVNGSKDSNSGVSSSALTSFPNSSDNLVVGANSSLAGGMDGMITNIAFWNRVLTDAEFESLAIGISPLMIANGLVSHIPLLRSAIDVVTGVNGTPANSPSIDVEPSIVRPSAQILQFPPTAAAAGFSPYWAAGSNVLMNNGSP